MSWKKNSAEFEEISLSRSRKNTPAANPEISKRVCVFLYLLSLWVRGSDVRSKGYVLEKFFNLTPLGYWLHYRPLKIFKKNFWKIYLWVFGVADNESDTNFLQRGIRTKKWNFLVLIQFVPPPPFDPFWSKFFFRQNTQKSLLRIVGSAPVQKFI